MEWIPYWNNVVGVEEIEMITKSIKDRCLSQGRVTKEFEESFAKELKVPYAVGTSSGSMALYLSLLALGIGWGDEVIVPDMTFIATAHAVYLTGAKVRFVDTHVDTPLMDVEQIETLINENTKAIIPVHLNGESVDMTKIHELAKKYRLYVIEEACQGLFSKNKDGFLGTGSLVGCFSFSVAKLITTAQGGMIVTKDESLYKKIRLMRTHGLESTFETEAYEQMGFNFRMTDIHASIGIEQLKKASVKMKRMKDVYSIYKNGIKNKLVRFGCVEDEERTLPLYMRVLTDYRDDLIEHMKKNFIETRACAPCLHTAEYFGSEDDCPNATKLQKKLLYLPTGPNQPLENVERVVEIINKFKM